MFTGFDPPGDAIEDPGPIPDDGQSGDVEDGGVGPAHRLAKIRLASSRVSLDPMSYQMPGTDQVWTGSRG